MCFVIRTNPLRWRQRSKFLASFGFSEPDLDHFKFTSTILVKQDDIHDHRRQISGTSPSHEYVSPAPVYLSLWSMVFEAFVISLYRSGPILMRHRRNRLIEERQSSALNVMIEWLTGNTHDC